MSSRQKAQFSITWNQVSAFRLARHHLLERAPAMDLVQAAGEMTGAQAQLLSAAQISLWSRVQDLKTELIEQALSERALVKAACMRQTLFLVPAEHLAVFVRGSARRAEKEVRWALGKGVPERIIDEAIDAALNALDQPLTRPEIAERVSQILGVQKQAVYGGGWGRRSKVTAVPVGDLTYPVVDLLHLAAARGVVCYGPNHGNEPTFVRADAWIPQWQDVLREQAEEILLRKYLKAFGPATARDFALWTGMTLREAREIWAREQTDLVTVDVEGWRAEVLREDLVLLAEAHFEQPLVRLLPYFDSFLLGHKDRDHLVDPQHRLKVYRPQGWVAPVVLVNGRIAAVWKYAQEGEQLYVEVTQFEPITMPVIAGLRREARELARFLGFPEVEVRVR